MAVPTISLLPTTPHLCRYRSQASCDFDLNSRSFSLMARPQWSAPTVKHANRGDRGSFRRLNQYYKKPMSVFRGPVSCGTRSGIGFVPTSRSPSLRTFGENTVSVRSSSGGLFNRAVLHSSGSVGYDFEDNVSAESDLEPAAKELLLNAQCRHNIFHDDLVIKAFYKAERSHRGQVRAGGHNYLQHCVDTAVLVALIGADATVVSAAILHDAVDDASVKYEHISKLCGSVVADLVEGVSKLSMLSKLARENNTASKTKEAYRLHTMFLAMTDVRAVLIKLADRLQNIITLESLHPTRQHRFAKETLEIFVPLANRLGISTWKEQLENICFMYLNPVQHRELSSAPFNSFGESTITSAMKKLQQALKDGSVAYHDHDLSGRQKSLYSIYKKLVKKNLNIYQIFDIFDIYGLRVVVEGENESECYRALSVVHHLWQQVPGRFKDYIVNPKPTGYRSLHTVVWVGMNVPLEVQIRTKDMHLHADAGHWKYKEGEYKLSSFVEQLIQGARWVVSCETSLKPPYTFTEATTYSCKPSFAADVPVIVVVIENAKMSVQKFPAKTTVKDLLERAGWVNYEFLITLNRVLVSDTVCELKMGDVVRLLTLQEESQLLQRSFDSGSFLSHASSLPFHEDKKEGCGC